MVCKKTTDNRNMSKEEEKSLMRIDEPDNEIEILFIVLPKKRSISVVVSLLECSKNNKIKQTLGSGYSFHYFTSLILNEFIIAYN